MRRQFYQGDIGDLLQHMKLEYLAPVLVLAADPYDPAGYTVYQAWVDTRPLGQISAAAEFPDGITLLRGKRQRIFVEVEE